MICMLSSTSLVIESNEFILITMKETRRTEFRAATITFLIPKMETPITTHQDDVDTWPQSIHPLYNPHGSRQPQTETRAMYQTGPSNPNLYMMNCATAEVNVTLPAHEGDLP
jgi:hypothetical protein